MKIRGYVLFAILTAFCGCQEVDSERKIVAHFETLLENGYFTQAIDYSLHHEQQLGNDSLVRVKKARILHRLRNSDFDGAKEQALLDNVAIAPLAEQVLRERLNQQQWLSATTLAREFQIKYEFDPDVIAKSVANMAAGLTFDDAYQLLIANENLWSDAQFKSLCAEVAKGAAKAGQWENAINIAYACRAPLLDYASIGKTLVFATLYQETLPPADIPLLYARSSVFSTDPNEKLLVSYIYTIHLMQSKQAVEAQRIITRHKLDPELIGRALATSASGADPIQFMKIYWKNKR